MGWYKRTKFIFNVFHTSRIIPIKNPIEDSIFVKVKFQQYKNFNGGDIFKCNKLVSPFIRSGYSLNNGFLNHNKVNPFAQNGLKRFYSADKDEDEDEDEDEVVHFRPRGVLENLLGVSLIGIGIVLRLFFGKWEIVPYTKRKHFVMVSKSLEMHLGEFALKKAKKKYRGKILPEIHPDSVRVRLVGKEIIDSLQKELNKEHVWTDHGYASVENIELYGIDRDDSLQGSSNERVEGTWSKADEILDDKRVQQSRKKGEVVATGHLDWRKWEFLVVDKPDMIAYCMPGGKIVVYTGLLKHYKSDAEIATIIGHEVAHVVARHFSENFAFKLLAPCKLTIASILRSFHHGVRCELEADYIGMLLMASAGYDPRVAPRVLEKLGKITGTSPRYFPSEKKRVQCLTQAKVMEEAQLVYREFLSNPSNRRNEISRKRRGNSSAKK